MSTEGADEHRGRGAQREQTREEMLGIHPVKITIVYYSKFYQGLIQ